MTRARFVKFRDEDGHQRIAVGCVDGLERFINGLTAHVTGRRFAVVLDEEGQSLITVQEERMRIFNDEFLYSVRDPLQRRVCQRFLSLKDGTAKVREVQASGDRDPGFQPEQRCVFAVCRFWPADGLSVRAERCCPFCGISVLSGSI